MYLLLRLYEGIKRSQNFFVKIQKEKQKFHAFTLIAYKNIYNHFYEI